MPRTAKWRTGGSPKSFANSLRRGAPAGSRQAHDLKGPRFGSCPSNQLNALSTEVDTGDDRAINRFKPLAFDALTPILVCFHKWR